MKGINLKISVFLAMYQGDAHGICSLCTNGLCFWVDKSASDGKICEKMRFLSDTCFNKVFAPVTDYFMILCDLRKKREEVQTIILICRWDEMHKRKWKKIHK